MDLIVRSQLLETDVAGIEAVTRSSGFFSEEETAIAVELARAALAERDDYLFLVAELGPKIVGFSCHGRIPATRSSYDLYWIAVAEGHRGEGIGRAILAAVEADVAARGGTRIYVDTAGRDQYAPTRRFYRDCGYLRAAVLDDFYAPGDAKVIYVKILG